MTMTASQAKEALHAILVTVWDINSRDGYDAAKDFLLFIAPDLRELHEYLEKA
jgi:hypothetical protein